MAVAARGLRSRQPPSLIKRHSSNGKINYSSSFSDAQSPRKNTRGFHRANRDVYISQTYPHLIISGLSPAQFAEYAPESDESSDDDEVHADDPSRALAAGDGDYGAEEFDEDDDDPVDEPEVEPLRKRRRVEDTPTSSTSLSPVKRPMRSSRQSLLDVEADVRSNGTPLLSSAQATIRAASARLEHVVELGADAARFREVSASPIRQPLQAVPMKRTHSSRLLSELGSRHSSRAGVSPSPPATQVTSPAPSLPDSQVELAARGASTSPQPLKDPDELLDSDLPPPFLPELSPPPSPSAFQDRAGYILATKFAPIPVPRDFVRALTSHDVSERSTETLFRLAANTQRALVAWQNQYLELDAKTAPIQNPPRKVATGGRVPLEASIYERAKEIELWGHVLGVEGTMAAIDGTGRRAAAPPPVGIDDVQTGGRALRRRHADASLADGLVPGSDDEAGGVGKRTRKPVRRFDVGSNQESRRKRRAAGDAASTQTGSRKRGRLDELAAEDLSRTPSPTPDSNLERLSDAAGNSETEWPAQRSTASRGRASRGRGRGGRGRGKRATGPSGRLGETPEAQLESPQLLHPLPANTATKVPIPKATFGVPNESLAAKPATTDSENGESLLASGALPQRRQRVKSEKRSESMTAWWAQRKKKAAEDKIRELREKGLLDRNGAPVPGAGAHAAGYMMGGTPMMQFAPQPPQQVWSLPPSGPLQQPPGAPPPSAPPAASAQQPPPPPPPPSQPTSQQSAQQPAQQPAQHQGQQQQRQGQPPAQYQGLEPLAYAPRPYAPHLLNSRIPQPPPPPAPPQQQQQPSSQQQQQQQQQQQRQLQESQQQQQPQPQQQHHPHHQQSHQQPPHHHQQQQHYPHQHQHHPHPAQMAHYGPSSHGPPLPHPAQMHGYPQGTPLTPQQTQPPTPMPPQYAQQPLHGQGRAGYMFGR